MIVLLAGVSHYTTRSKGNRRKAINYTEIDDDDCFEDVDDDLDPDWDGSRKTKQALKAAGEEMSSSSSSSEDETTQQAAVDIEPEFVNYDWVESDISETEVLNYEDDDDSLPEDDATPISYFKLFFDDELIQLITDQTNLYSSQQGHALNVTPQEINDFLSIMIYMGIMTAPSYHDYWNTITRVPQVASIMTRKRFIEIKANLHFTDNSKRNENDKDCLRAIRPIYENLQKKCQNLKQCETKFSIDEAMVATKSKKWGLFDNILKASLISGG